jgi:predicted ATPase
MSKIYLKSLELKSTYRNIKPFSIYFKEGLNLIVGENGSGKSTLLDLLAHPDSNKEIKDINADPVDFMFFDTEKNNPRIKGDLSNSKNIGFEVDSHFISHGEAMLPIIMASKSFKDLLLLIDEPEAGISLNNQKKILAALNKAIENNCQIVISTHSYVFIKSVPKVFNMDDKIWIDSEEYLDKILSN